MIEAGVTYVWRDGKLVPKSEVPLRHGVWFWSDVPHYKSPLSGKEITSRSERREEMKRFNVREIEPSEGPHRDGSRYNNKDFMRKHGILEEG